MTRMLVLGALMLPMTGWPIGATQGGTNVTVSELKPGVVCRSTQGERIPGDRPQTPFQAEVATFDRVKQKGRDCYFNPGEYSTTPQSNAPNSDCPSGQIADQSGKIKGTRSGDDLHWCDE